MHSAKKMEQSIDNPDQLVQLSTSIPESYKRMIAEIARGEGEKSAVIYRRAIKYFLINCGAIESESILS